MNLTAEQFEALARLTRPTSGGACTEKRRAARVGNRGSVMITPCDGALGGEPRRIVVQIANLSPRGVGLVHTRRLEPGQQFVIHLPREGKPEAHLLCTVVHCEQRSTGRYSVGAEFTCSVEPRGAAQAGTDPGLHARIQQSILQR